LVQTGVLNGNPGKRITPELIGVHGGILETPPAWMFQTEVQSVSTKMHKAVLDHVHARKENGVLS
jgi:hypothetical protein